MDLYSLEPLAAASGTGGSTRHPVTKLTASGISKYGQPAATGAPPPLSTTAGRCRRRAREEVRTKLYDGLYLVRLCIAGIL